MYAAKNDKYTLLMLPDDDAPNPREDCGCFGKMPAALSCAALQAKT